MHNPSEDGRTHINIYSGGATELGQGLSNFAPTPFECEDGRFESVEGYWHWLHAEGIPEREVLRSLHGTDALYRGRQIRAGQWMADEAKFKSKIARAIQCKLEQHPQLKRQLVNSTLPFTHYYVMGGVARDAGHEWLVHLFNRLRLVLKHQAP